ncbi:hypothetical protein ACOW0P_27025, partial [Klebsiella pneumoniae]|nr:hypothetical protein [Klebsiella pneumoniae]
QTETEATGAPQKHHYTLNQQVGSITLVIYLYALFNCGRSPIKNWRFFNAGILNIYDKMELFIKKGI